MDFQIEIKYNAYLLNKINSLQLIAEIYNDIYFNNKPRNVILQNCNKIAIQKMLLLDEKNNK